MSNYLNLSTPTLSFDFNILIVDIKERGKTVRNCGPIIVKTKTIKYREKFSP